MKQSTIHITILKIWLCLFFILITPNIYSQTKMFETYEDSLRLMSEIMFNDSNQIQRKIANTKFLDLWEPVLDEPKSMNHPFKSLKNISILTSQDEKIRFINWAIPKENETYLYNAIIQYYNDNKKYNVIYLTNVNENLEDLEDIQTKNNNWLGALYYQLEDITINNETCYVLIGWNGNDERSNKKIVDILKINTKLIFGLPIFKIHDKIMKRFIIEYKEDASVSMKFNVKENRILFNHLIPLNRSLNGLYDFYVPDGSVDALKFKNEKFIFEENVETIEKIEVPKKKNIKGGLFPK